MFVLLYTDPAKNTNLQPTQDYLATLSNSQVVASRHNDGTNRNNAGILSVAKRLLSSIKVAIVHQICCDGGKNYGDTSQPG